MAENKSSTRAEKAVSDAKKKSSGSRSGSGKKNTSPAKRSDTVKKEAPAQKKRERVIPVNAIIAFVSIALFILFLVVAVNPDGALLKVIESAVLGLIGRAAFYISIPALLYLFVIHVFGAKKSLRMRSVCLGLFVLFCGCISHLSFRNQVLDTGIALIGDLYKGGSAGYAAGVICGLIAMLVRWACGNVISYILFGIGAALTLLGAMQITIPSIFRAINNRPRDEFEDESDEDEYIEPAAVVVNHLANKHIEYTRQRRQRQETAQEPVLIDESQSDNVKRQARISAPAKELEPAASNPRPVKTGNSKADDMMNQIECEIASPVSAASERIVGGEGEIEIRASQKQAAIVPSAPVETTPVAEMIQETIPAKMPELKIEDPLPKAPNLEPIGKQTAVSKEEAVSAGASVRTEKISSKDAAESAVQVAAEIAQSQNALKPEYCFPPIDLLNRPVRGGADGTDEMRENTRRLNETLASFKIDAHIINVTRGPSVTRYEVELDKGVRLNKLTTCADDIALNLGASGVRIAAVPGKISVVGIEVPNRSVTMVSLREVIDSQAFDQSKSKSSFAVGKDIAGNCIVGNIAKMPHMLIAGTTGSGKSVCMNSIIISLLYKAGPEDVKLIMVDPKMVELGIYNGIPHLLIPVVTDPKKAAGSLQWAVTEMMRRYKSMSDAGVRDLESYNSLIVDEEDGQKLPQVVVIIDELADLMMVAAKEVEDSICRIAQMGRAAGIHLVIATQRPSADVITGLMKANIPSRIAFSVASAMESRIILDTQGAEKLVGKGDMLYAPIGNGKPLRVQGCFVTDTEVEAVASYVKDNYVADYNQQVLEEIERKALQAGKKAAAEPEPSDEELDGDELLPDAVEVILETQQASVSMLQRRLKLGYARAARIVDEMEEKGIVGPFQGSKPRAILITKEEWEARKEGQGTQLDFSDLEEDDYGPVPEDF